MSMRRVVRAAMGVLLACGLAVAADGEKGEVVEGAKPGARWERQLEAAQETLGQLQKQLEEAVEPELRKVTEEMVALQNEIIEKTKAIAAATADGAKDAVKEIQKALSALQAKMNALRTKQGLLLEIQRLRALGASAANDPQVQAAIEKAIGSIQEVIALQDRLAAALEAKAAAVAEAMRLAPSKAGGAAGKADRPKGEAPRPEKEKPAAPKE